MLFDPCPVCCRNELLWIEKRRLFCPICDAEKEGLFLIPRQDTQEILDIWLRSHINVLKIAIIGKYEKYSLLQWVVDYLNSIVFLLDTPLVPIEHWLAAISLLKFINRQKYWVATGQLNPFAQFIWATWERDNVPKLIDLMRSYNILQEWSLYIDEKYSWGALFSKQRKISLEKLKEASKELPKRSLREIFSEFELIWLEKTTMKMVIEPSLAEKGAAPHSQALKKFEQRKAEYEAVLKEPIKPVEDINAFLREGGLSFSLFNSILQKNALWDGILHIKDKDLNYMPLLRFYFYSLDQKSLYKVKDFLKITREFGITDRHLEIILLSEKNIEALPLFIQIDSKYVMFSKRNYYFLLMFLLVSSPIGQKELRFAFERDGEEFALVDVPRKFQEIPHMETKRIETKKLEIDLLAYNKKMIFVIEIKRWDFKPLLINRRRLGNIDRDLRGIVDGIKYTTKTNGELQEKLRPSLLEKVFFIENHKKEYCLPELPVVALIITRLYPTRKSYKKCHFLSYEEISEQKIQIIQELSLKSDS